MYKSTPDETGQCDVYFELNGQARIVRVLDQNQTATKPINQKADGDNQIGAPIPGKLVEIKVKPGDVVKDNDPLFIIEAMKMETTITAIQDGVIKSVLLSNGDLVESNDLVIEFE